MDQTATLSNQDHQKLDNFFKSCLHFQHRNIGYPVAADFNYSELFKFLQFSLNNCGDWAQESNNPLNTFRFEKEVMEYFSDKFGTCLSESWGYVTNGGTEGNMYCCLLAREKFPQGTLYYSEDSHYSVDKIVKLLRIKHKVIKSLPNGEINYDELKFEILINKESNPIIFANIGTTLYGATDDIAKIQTILSELNFKKNEFYLHADAALNGMILPFVDQPQPYNFSDGIDSISVSGHKMIGGPIPCGIVLAKAKNVESITNEVDYIAAPDKTISGSRNGFTPLVLWHAINSTSEAQKRARVQGCLNLAKELTTLLIKKGIPAWRNCNSIIVVFPTPSESIWRKYGLANSKKHAHVVVTGHMIENPSLLYQLAEDMAKDIVNQRKNEAKNEATHC
ncbi:histidine decarboxylase [Shewanella sp.]|uniref:histidine decarboxylase n=1 Tax=Shewanella sp. TaxID=50422 RepID=UPI001ED2D66C|nr:histidine decarboxylase [Shewanella sp.]NRB23772.1 histidine decarboxylase [Shewanella sp.]